MDALGNPLRVRLTAGQRHEATQAHALVEGLAAGWVIADTAFDSDPFRARLAEQGTGAVIPSNTARSEPIAHDEHLDQERHLVECFINKIVSAQPIPSCRRRRRSEIETPLSVGGVVW